jgi:hypothetical protein
LKNFLNRLSKQLGVLDYKGAWNALTNSPSLSHASGKKGEYYICSTGGSSFLQADVGDWLIHNGIEWQRMDMMDKSFIAPATTLYENNAQVYADGAQPSADPSGREGWYFKNTTAGSKVNWYFFSASQQTVTLGGIGSFWAVVTLYKTRLPFFSLYTAPQPGGGNAASWYRSRVSYVGTNPATTGTYLLHTGTDPGVFPGLPRILMSRESFSARGPEGSGEVVLTALLSSDSSASANTTEFTCPRISFSGNTVSFRIQSSMTIERAKHLIELLEARIIQLESASN